MGSRRLDDVTSSEWDEAFRQMKHRPKETQIGGDHYRTGDIQPIDYIMANKMNFAEGNVIKYVTRHRNKGGKQDILKAMHYLDFLLEEYNEYEESEKKYEKERGIY
jgi:hypothetical protein